MHTVNAYAATSATAPLVPITIQRRNPGPKDVLIEIDYAGICHSDIHLVRGHWGPVTYPQVVGHEIVGHVREVGAQVTKHKVGDRVAVGCESNSCRVCEQCRTGHEQYCLNGNIQTYGGVDVDGTITRAGTRKPP
ncbi:alcohol dehydrogenase catalytic domain-containing protein [Nonomuraea sp. NPDC046802]|uniref:alcohol dehydrogenase catalytic domain-containing protein n=1 Tax=Nonomuraea sp. NPDC046802 TaxID=3154919 RepID=UPI0033E61BCB